jgi:hypothetical protein
MIVITLFKKTNPILFNIIDITAYILPILTSIRWIKSISDGNGDGESKLIAFSCLFLDLKFLLFLRGIEYFGVYFAIIINVARQVVSFLMLLLIIVIGFAHGFFILLAPSTDVFFKTPPPDFNAIDGDDNNPWNIPDKFQTFNGNTAVADQFTIAPPDENANMFIDFRTSLLAMYFFLTGLF